MTPPQPTKVIYICLSFPAILREACICKQIDCEIRLQLGALSPVIAEVSLVMSVWETSYYLSCLFIWDSWWFVCSYDKKCLQRIFTWVTHLIICHRSSVEEVNFYVLVICICICNLTLYIYLHVCLNLDLYLYINIFDLKFVYM